MSDSTAQLYGNVVRVLRTGFRIAAGLLLIGLAVALIRQEPLAHETDPLREIPASLAQFHSAAFIDLAIIAIVLTPVAAVIAIAISFRRSDETLFARCATGVLAVLLCSIALSLLR